MSKIDKLISKFRTEPKDLTWNQPIRVLKYYHFEEIGKKGNTRRFSNEV